jgi:hypothetical protein
MAAARRSHESNHTGARHVQHTRDLHHTRLGHPGGGTGRGIRQEQCDGAATPLRSRLQRGRREIGPGGRAPARPPSSTSLRRSSDPRSNPQAAEQAFLPLMERHCAAAAGNPTGQRSHVIVQDRLQSSEFKHRGRSADIDPQSAVSGPLRMPRKADFEAGRGLPIEQDHRVPARGVPRGIGRERCCMRRDPLAIGRQGLWSRRGP